MGYAMLNPRGFAQQRAVTAPETAQEPEPAPIDFATLAHEELLQLASKLARFSDYLPKKKLIAMFENERRTNA